MTQKKKNTNTETHLQKFDTQSQHILRDWFSRRSLAKSTQKVYAINLKQWTNYHKTTPYQIYKKAFKEQQEEIPETLRYLTRIILDYKYFLDNSNYSQTTKYLKLKVITSFCQAFQLETPNIRIKRPICEEKNYERPITREELLLMLNSSPLREQAFLGIQATTGMGSQEVRTLQIHHILTSINNECQSNYHTLQQVITNKEEILKHKIFEFNITRRKVNYRYITYTTSDTMERILRYLEYRMNTGGHIHLEDGNPHNYVFVTHHGEPMDQKAVTGMYRVMGEKVGFQSQPFTYRFWRSHNIRKYFYNIVEDVVGSEYADEWLGHVPSSVTRAYARREFRMRNAYMKCLPYLSLANVVERGSERVERKIKLLEEELENLKSNF